MQLGRSISFSYCYVNRNVPTSLRLIFVAFPFYNLSFLQVFFSPLCNALPNTDTETSITAEYTQPKGPVPLCLYPVYNTSMDIICTDTFSRASELKMMACLVSDVSHGCVVTNPCFCRSLCLITVAALWEHMACTCTQTGSQCDHFPPCGKEHFWSF